ncbi:Bug family tripartite tricarboxylate transporter substrate binding protein [Phreatobacter stygius]|uniref:Tripartite tricarboxylate transporter substrate binding protein n=1 Tax=Phreatobacter stygius TaxID=1940610 RepID=A0A4D7BKP8_9HYPH|nr:tripartite tricarboxylate transporter substrate binding protein [Phreatobacter stygius]QCI68317.1 tripartite tricarboxylate transporter substrate binding protein [Phreatobacter stygius]
MPSKLIPNRARPSLKLRPSFPEFLIRKGRHEMISRRSFHMLAAGWGATALSRPASASTFPDRTISIVVPFPAGSGTDSVARLVQPLMSSAIGGSIIIDNRAGATGTLAPQFVSRAPGDGYAILMATSTSNIISPALGVNNSYHPIDDFAPVGLIGVFPFLLAVGSTFPATNVRELIDYAKKSPTPLQYAVGNGTGLLAGAAFKEYAGIDTTAIPYRGTPPALTDLMAGRVQYMFVDATTALSHIRAGTIRALGVTTAKPSELLPGVPPVAAAGLPKFDIAAWCGLSVPKATPTDVISKLEGALQAALGTQGLRQRMADIGFEHMPLNASGFATYVATDSVKMRNLIADARVTQL